MTSRRPEIFVSATSGDLRSARLLIKEGLLTLGCVPIEQTNFPPDYRTVREMLRTKIAVCDAVVHLAGEVYGAEPTERAPGDPHRSYTQMEYDLARELGKPLYTFVCDDDFAYDEHPPEPDQKRSLQQTHRAALQSGENLFYAIHSRHDLSLKIRELQTRVEALGAELTQTRSWLSRGVTVALITLVLLGGALWVLNSRTDHTLQTVARLETELDQQRRYIRSVADAFTAQQAELDQLKLTDAQKFDRALARVALHEKIPENDLRAGINLFVAATQADPKADFMDRALAEFAQKNFAAAAHIAGEAARAALDEYRAAEHLAAKATAQANEARTRAREAFGLQGQSYYAAGNFAEAVTAYQSALAATPRSAAPDAWGDLQARLGQAANQWAATSTDDELIDRRNLALAAYRAALESFHRAAAPEFWALIQHNFGITLETAAENARGPDRATFLQESVAAYRAALEVRTREAAPEDWAMTQNNLAIALRHQAAGFSDARRPTLLAESATAYRAALAVLTPETQPDISAQLQSNLASTLIDLAEAAPTSERAALFEDATNACYAALDVFTEDHQPLLWAATQNNLANTLRGQADCTADGERRASLLDLAASAYRAALIRCTREVQPHEWATIQNNLANVTQARAQLTDGRERFQLLNVAIAGYSAALEVSTRDTTPQDWAMTQNNLAIALSQLAPLVTEADRPRLFQDAARAFRATLLVYTRETLPIDWAKGQSNLALTLREQADLVAPAERPRLLTEAVTAMRACLEVITPEVNQDYHTLRTGWLTEVEALLAQTPPNPTP